MAATAYPPADTSSQWYGAGNATVAPTAVLWHTTETAGGWPGYAGGAEAPNLTYDPWLRAWRQHFPLNGTARALANAGDFQTNRAGVCQVELSCYCDPARFSTGFGVDRLDEQAYADLGAFASFMTAGWGIPLATTVSWLPYPASYGANGVRLDPAGFTAYAGHLGHQHAPGNDHGDPGQLDVARIVGAEPSPAPEEDDEMKPWLLQDTNGSWWITDLATYKTFAQSSALVNEGQSFGAWQLYAGGAKLGPGWSDLIDKLPRVDA